MNTYQCSQSNMQEQSLPTPLAFVTLNPIATFTTHEWKVRYCQDHATTYLLSHFISWLGEQTIDRLPEK